MFNIRKQKDFLEFLKYWPSSHGLNKLVIKAKMHANTYIDFWNFICCVKICCYNIYIYILERLGRMHENKTFFFVIMYFLMFWRKSGILILGLYSYSIKIWTSIDQNTVIKLQQNHIFFEIIFEEFLKFVFFFFGPGLARPMWLGWTQQALPGRELYLTWTVK